MLYFTFAVFGLTTLRRLDELEPVAVSPRLGRIRGQEHEVRGLRGEREIP